MIKTELCDMVGIRHPIIQAGMGPYSTNKLAIAAANAGVLGLISTSGFSYLRGGTVPKETGVYELVKTLVDGEGGSWHEQMKRVYQRVKENTRESRGIFGINCMVATEMRSLAKEVIETAIEARKEDPELGERMRVIVTSAGDPLPWTETIKPSGVKWFHVVPSVRHALRAERAGVDAVIASGQEGGGHVAWEPVHSMVLLPAVIKGVNIPVIGAGGFGDGASLAAALVLGAVGAQMGTRFLATQESDFTQMQKEYIVKSGERNTIVARGYVGPARYLRNKASEELTQITVSKVPGVYLGQPDDLSNVPKEVMNREEEGAKALYSEDEPKALMFGGEVAGRVDDLPSVKEMVERMVKEAEEIIRGLPKRVLGE